MNNYLLSSSILCLVILILIILLKRLNQPYPVAYMFSGIILGPSLLKVFRQADQISQLGDFGILFLMFFLGIEIEVPDHRNLLLKPVLIQIVKTILTVIFIALIGQWLQWNLPQIAVLCAILVFNSTAVVTEYAPYKQWNER